MKRTAVLFALAITITCTGCGSGGGKINRTVQNTMQNNIDPAESTESQVMEDGILHVGTHAEFPPFEYVGDNGKLDGFDIALITAICEKLNLKVEIDNMDFDSLIDSIGNKIDISIAGMTITEDRKNMVDFSDPYYEAMQDVIVTADSDITEAEDLDGKSIGVEFGTTGDMIAGEMKNVYVSHYNKAANAINDLVNGRIDAVIIDRNPAVVFQDKFEDQLKIINGTEFDFIEEEYAIALPKGDTVLANAINNALREIKKDGTFDELVSRYIEENQ